MGEQRGGLCAHLTRVSYLAAEPRVNFRLVWFAPKGDTNWKGARQARTPASVRIVARQRVSHQVECVIGVAVILGEKCNGILDLVFEIEASTSAGEISSNLPIAEGPDLICLAVFDVFRDGKGRSNAKHH